MSFDITSYDARRRQTQECKDYQKTYQSKWIKDNCEKKRQEKLVIKFGVSTLKDFFS